MASDERQPYVGLVPFSEEDTAYFAGRARERRIIAANLQVARLTLLYGPSGVGKSSLLRAGVKPDLERPTRRAVAEPPLPQAIVVLFDKWARDDLPAALESTLSGAVRAHLTLDPPRPADGAERTLFDAIGAWEARLRDVIGDTYGVPPPQLLFVFDQFEDYFRYHGEEDGPGTFANEFPRAVRDPRLHASFLVSIREDAYASLDLFEDRIPELFSNYLRLDYLDRDAAEAAIREPLAIYNALPTTGEAVRIEDELVEAVLYGVRKDDVGRQGPMRRPDVDDSGVQGRVDTAYLQLVMQRLWNSKSSNVLALATYQQLGGAEKILEGYLRETMESLNDEEKQLAAAAFYLLVTPTGSKMAHTAQDLAAYAAQEAAASSVQAVQKTLEPVLGRLVDRRILRTSGAARRDNATTYEVYHDVLTQSVRKWRARYLAEVEQQERFDFERQAMNRPERVSFPQLVQARYEVEDEVRRFGKARVETEARFRVMLAVFEAAEGRVVSAYWGTRTPAGVAVTERFPTIVARLVGRPSYELLWLAASIVREDPQVGALLHRCDLVASKTSELPPTVARNELESIAAVAGQLIALSDRDLSEKERHDALLAQEVALDRIAERSRGESEEVARLSSWWGQSLLGLFLLALGAALLYSLVAVWPAVQSSAAGGTTRTVSWFGYSYSPSDEAGLLLVVVLASALGSYLHAVVSFAEYVGNRRLAQSWVWWYLLRVPAGSSLAVLVYAAIRGGFSAAGSGTDDINLYGVAAIAGFVGLAARQATDKLRETINKVFRVMAPEVAVRADQILNPAPVLTATEPTALQIGELSITLVGSGFVTGSVVRVARAGRPELARVTVFQGPQRLAVGLEADEVAAEGELLFTVHNPPPGGGASDAVEVPVGRTRAERRA